MSESISKHSVKTAWVMIIFTLVGTLALALMHQQTREPIAEAEAETRMRLFSQVISQEAYDNDLLHDTITIPAGGALNNREETLLYRARLANKPSAVVMQVTAPDGYSGDIKLLMAIDMKANVLGVRVIAHRETPGLGDYIDVAHDSWIEHFKGASLALGDDAWAVKKDGGQFVYRTGATISPRAVVKAVHQAVKIFAQQRDAIFKLPAQQSLQLGDPAS